jgi:HUS1 checkpoint protein
MKVGLECGRTLSNRARLNELTDLQGFSQIKILSIFIDYHIQSHGNNEITMAISSEAFLPLYDLPLLFPRHLERTRRMMKLAKKLAKKNDRAVLKFEIIVKTTVGR